MHSLSRRKYLPLVTGLRQEKEVVRVHRVSRCQLLWTGVSEGGLAQTQRQLHPHHGHRVKAQDWLPGTEQSSSVDSGITMQDPAVTT